LNFGNIYFPTRKAAEAHVRAILSRYRNMYAVRGADRDFIFALIDQHPRRSVIVDCGLKDCCVQWLDDAGVQRRFMVIRTDSSRRDWSWRNVIYPKPQLGRLQRVCRSLVADQVSRFRVDAFAEDIKLECPYTGESMSRDTCDVHHEKPEFVDLVVGWLQSIHLDADDIEIVPARGYQQPDRLADRGLEMNWQGYHKINAKLQIVSRTANRSLLRRRAGEAA
jgi:hypothetical protein